MMYLWQYRLRRLFRDAFCERTSRVREFGPFVADWKGAVFVQINAFYRWSELWLGASFSRADSALTVCCLGVGVKIKTIYRERSR